MRPHGSPKELEERRFRAISLLKEGYQPVDISQIVGVDRRSVRRWWAAYTKEAQNRPASPLAGPPPKLDARDKKAGKGLRTPCPQALTSDPWTWPRVARLTEMLFGIRYHAHHVSKLLHSPVGLRRNPKHCPVRGGDFPVFVILDYHPFIGINDEKGFEMFKGSWRGTAII